jgi:hypothetical protein
MKGLNGRWISNQEDDMNRILSREDEILPSSGFAASVMDAVRREAAAPPPIPFPWKRAMPGLVVAVLALAAALVAGVVSMAQLAKSSTTQQFSVSLPSVLPSVVGFGFGFGSGSGFALQRNLEYAGICTVLALLVTWMSVKLSMRLAVGRI